MQDIFIAHQSLVQRYGAKVARDVLPFMNELESYLKDRLKQEGGSIETKARLSALLVDSRSHIIEIMGEMDDAISEELIEFVEEEVDFNLATFQDVEHVTPSAEQIYVAATRTPMVLQNQSVSLSDAQKGLTSSSVRKINSYIQGGFYSGQTTQEITSNIVNAVGQTKRDAQTTVRTATNFLSNETRQEVFEENKNIVIGYQIVATLDVRTSDICKSYDGDIFYYSDGRNQPMPPLHWNCRSTIKPVLSEKYDYLQRGSTRASKGAEGGKQVSENTDYYTWLKGQPAYIQDEALGKTKGLIFRNAGLSTDEFKQAATDRMNQPLTLDEMKQKNAKIAEYLS